MERQPPDGGGVPDGKGADGDRGNNHVAPGTDVQSPTTTKSAASGCGPHQTDVGATVTSNGEGNNGSRESEARTSDQDGTTTHTAPEQEHAVSEPTPGSDVGNYVGAVLKQPHRTHASALTAAVSTIGGRWKPRERHVLLETLAKSWNGAAQPQVSSNELRLRDVALRASEVRKDEALRQRTPTETEALLAYLNGELEIAHAPNFLKATMTVMQRAMMEQFHEQHVEATLTAVVAPRAKLRKSLTHIALFALLYEANSDTGCGRAMIDRMMDDVKRLHFDGIHTLSFVFHSKRLARWYSGIALRLQGVCIFLEDTETSSQTGVLQPARLRRQYAVHVYGAEALGMVALLAALGKLPGVTVADAERPRVDSTDIINTRYMLVSFWGLECPSGLRGITKLFIDGHLLTLHHHLLHPRMPCARYYAPFHTTGFCKATYSQQLRGHEKFKRSYTGAIARYAVGDATQYRHSDGDSLACFLETLQRDVTLTMAQTALEVQERPAITTDTATRQRGHSPLGPNRTADVAENGGQPPKQEISVPGTRVESETTSADGSSATTPQASSTVDRNSATYANGHGQRQFAASKGQDPTSSSDSTQGVATPQQRSPTKQAAGQTRAGTGRKKGKGNVQTRNPAPAATSGFAAFNRQRAIGRYARIMEDSDDSESEDSTDENEEAAYAYPATSTILSTPAVGTDNGVDDDLPEDNRSETGLIMDVDEDHETNYEAMDEEEDSSQSYVGSSPKHNPSLQCQRRVLHSHSPWTRKRNSARIPLQRNWIQPWRRAPQ